HPALSRRLRDRDRGRPRHRADQDDDLTARHGRRRRRSGAVRRRLHRPLLRLRHASRRPVETAAPSADLREGPHRPGESVGAPAAGRWGNRQAAGRLPAPGLHPDAHRLQGQDGHADAQGPGRGRVVPARRALAGRRRARALIMPNQALAEALFRIKTGNASLKAFACLRGDASAMALAQQLSGPLAGQLVAVKDIFDTADLPTAYGSPIYAGHQPATEAALVAIVRSAGGLVIGKSVTTEFAYLHPADTLNPAAPGCTPGGSSAGSAAAVAAGLVPLAIGSQTGGSTIRPASYCGIVGFKPSFAVL